MGPIGRIGRIRAGNRRTRRLVRPMGPIFTLFRKEGKLPAFCLSVPPVEHGSPSQRGALPAALLDQFFELRSRGSPGLESAGFAVEPTNRTEPFLIPQARFVDGLTEDP